MKEQGRILKVVGGSYYLSFYYENTNIFGFKYRENDGFVPGVVSYKRVK